MLGKLQNHGGIHPDLAFRHQPYRPHEPLRRVALQKNSRRAELQGFRGGAQVPRPRHKQKPPTVARFTRRCKEIDASFRSEVEVEKNDIHLLPGEDVERFSCRAALARNFETRFHAKETAEARAKQTMIVKHEQSNTFFRHNAFMLRRVAYACQAHKPKDAQPGRKIFGAAPD
jgi:hypothetical protein